MAGQPTSTTWSCSATGITGWFMRATGRSCMAMTAGCLLSHRRLPSVLQRADPISSATLPRDRLHSVQHSVLFPHVGDPGRRRKRLARCTLEQLVGRELAPVLVHVLAEPAEQRGELPLLDLCIQVADVGADLFHQLRADQVSDRVARKDPEAHGRPVDILQHALAVVRDAYAEV